MIIELGGLLAVFIFRGELTSDFARSRNTEAGFHGYSHRARATIH